MQEQMDKSYVITEIVGVLHCPIFDAVSNAVARANQTIKALDWLSSRKLVERLSTGRLDNIKSLLMLTSNTPVTRIGRDSIMQDKTYKLIEPVGISETSIEDGIQNAIGRANQTLSNSD